MPPFLVVRNWSLSALRANFPIACLYYDRLSVRQRRALDEELEERKAAAIAAREALQVAAVDPKRTVTAKRTYRLFGPRPSRQDSAFQREARRRAQRRLSA